ncbi:MAG: phosphoribosylformylglycinamidine cyclo-ligase [Chloroflexota bacterium]|nr:phosphoribosylformylglycinamidine cyclo-ligase [Chloroflexota bacterium]
MITPAPRSSAEKISILPEASEPLTYAASGVDLEADALRIREIVTQVKRTHHGQSVIPLPGGFAGGINVSGVEEPLVACTDGVGTKTILHSLCGTFEYAGRDVVANNINDLIVTGATPTAFLDYLAMSDLPEGAVVDFVRGVATACIDNGIALISGETAEMPDIYASGHFDLAGTALGILRRGDRIDPAEIRAGDLVISISSGGLMTNGYSLARAALGIGGNDSEGESRQLLETRPIELSGETVGEALTRPHPSFWKQVDRLRKDGVRLKGMAHITGGGIAGNLSRIIPDHLSADIDPDSWVPPPIFGLVQERGSIQTEEMFRVFNMGLGIICILSPEDVGDAALRETGFFQVGEISRTDSASRVNLKGLAS